MTIGKRILTLTCAFALSASLAAAEPPTIADPATLDRLVAEQVKADDANRKIVREVLDRGEVTAVASAAGLDVERARQAVSTLSGAELQGIAEQARHVDASLAGGASTLVISTTTLIIILLVVILVLVAD